MSKTAIITGGASGMGVEMAVRLGKMGYNVVLTHVSDGSREKAKAVVERIKNETGMDAMAVQSDMADYDACKKLVDDTVKHFGQLNCVVCNAGICKPTKFLDMTPEQITREIAVDFTGVAYMCHVAMPYLIQDGVENPNIVVTSSCGGLAIIPDFCVYDAAKAAAISLVTNLASEFAPRVRVNSVAPGGVNTDMLQRNMKANPEYFEGVTDGIPMRRLVEMTEIADGMEYLINATAVTGHTLPVSAGQQLPLSCGQKTPWIF